MIVQKQPPDQLFPKADRAPGASGGFRGRSPDCPLRNEGTLLLPNAKYLCRPYRDSKMDSEYV